MTVPAAVVPKSSVTDPTFAPPKDAVSLAPWMVTVTVWLVPSSVETTNVSVVETPCFSACTSGLASSSV